MGLTGAQNAKVDYSLLGRSDGCWCDGFALVSWTPRRHDCTDLRIPQFFNDITNVALKIVERLFGVFKKRHVSERELQIPMRKALSIMRYKH